MKILIPVDGSEGSQKTLQWVARNLNPDLTHIWLLNVVFWTVDALVREDEIRDARNLLAQARTYLENAGFKVEQAQYMLGSPSKAINEYAEEIGVDQIIIGTEGHSGLGGALIGSVSREVFKNSHRSVLLLNTHELGTPIEINNPNDPHLALLERKPKNVLIPVDGSRYSQRTLTWAQGFLDREMSRIHLITAYDRTPEGGIQFPKSDDSVSILENARNKMESYGYSVVATESILGEPDTVICDYADTHDIDLIVMGSHGKSAITRFIMGSVSESVMKNAACPVIVLNNTLKPSVTIIHPNQVGLTDKD